MNDTPAPAPAGPEAAKLAPVPPTPAHRASLLLVVAEALANGGSLEDGMGAAVAVLDAIAAYEAALDALSPPAAETASPAPAPLHGRGWHDFESDMGGRFCVHCGGTLVGHGAINAPASPAPPAEPERCVRCGFPPSRHNDPDDPGPCRAPASPAPAPQGPEEPKATPPSPEPGEAERLREALQRAWNEWCDDTGSIPDCFRIAGPPSTRVYADFAKGNFVAHVAAALRPRPEEADPA